MDFAKSSNAGKWTVAELKVRRFESLLKIIDAKNDPEAFGETYLEYLGTCPEMIEGAVELIKDLHRKYRIAILTNGLKKVQRSCPSVRPSAITFRRSSSRKRSAMPSRRGNILTWPSRGRDSRPRRRC